MAFTHDVMFPAPGKDGKPRWTKVGAGFTNEKGQVSIKLEFVPVCTDPKGLWFHLFEPKPRDERQPAQTHQAPAPSSSDEEVPF